jgi:23S rRNA pseudouridine1911/1915/1917 synthase
MSRMRASEESFVRPEGVEEGAVVSVFRVPAELAGMRLDVFLKHELKRTSRTRAQAIIKVSAYGAEGQRLRSNDRVTEGQRILLWRPAWDETPVPRDLPLLFEDEHLLAIDKPPGVPVHPTARFHKNTVIKMLQAERPGSYLSLAHRIDRDTSGVLLVARSAEADRRIKGVFMGRDDIDKSYLAIVWGAPPTDTFRVDLPLELDPTSRTKIRMRVAAPGTGLHAGTRFVVLERRRRGSTDYALVRCDLETGRQHQIRVHLAAIGLPIVGDKLYAFDEGYFTRDIDGEATDEDRARLEIPRHALHATHLSLVHPFTGARLAIDSPLYPDLASFWDSLRPAPG